MVNIDSQLDCKVSAEAFKTLTSRVEQIHFGGLTVKVCLFLNQRVCSLTLEDCDIDFVEQLYLLSKVRRCKFDSNGTFDSLENKLSHF